MTTKQLLTHHIKSFENTIWQNEHIRVRDNKDAQPKPKQEACLVTGYKPAGYWLPQTNLSKKNKEGTEPLILFFAEVFINGKCIFRQSAYPSENHSKEDTEELVLQNLLKEIIFCGLSRAFEIINVRNSLKTFNQ